MMVGAAFFFCTLYLQASAEKSETIDLVKRTPDPVTQFLARARTRAARACFHESRGDRRGGGCA